MNQTQTLFDSAKGHKFFDAWEEVPLQERQETCRKLLLAYIEHARQVPFYQNRLRAVDGQSESPLSKVEPLTATALKALLPPLSTDLLTDHSGAYSVFQSGGTTGFPKTTLFSHDEMKLLDRANARGYFATGLLPQDRVGNLFACGSLYMTFIHINNMLQRYGCTNFAFAHVVEAEFFGAVMERFQVNALAGVGSTIINLLRSQYDELKDKVQLEKIFYGGEHLYDADKRLLQDMYGIKTILSPGYGTVDTWYIGYQCLHSTSGIHHTHDDQCYVEIVNEATGQPCAPGEVGMMYATPYCRRLTPVVRYRVGDQARWLKDLCACGRQTPLFQLLGRGDDQFRIGFDTIDYEQLKDVLDQFGTNVGHFQMERRRRDSKDQLVLRIETTLPKHARPQFAGQLAHAVLASRPALSKNIDEGTAWPILVELLDPKGIPLNVRTGKLIKVIDIDD